MAKDNLIAKKYAEALIELDSSEATLKDLKLISQVLNESSNFKTSLENPSIDEDAKLAIVDNIFKSSISKDSLNMLKLCITKRRTNIVSLLSKHYEAAYLEKNNIELACVETPSEISPSDLEDIKKQLEKVFNKGIQIEAKSNPELIAGMKINVNNKILDYSLNSKIKKLKQELES